MKNKYFRIIGSGSAEAVPDPMCDCSICNNARKIGGREIRSRSCFRVNETTQIDFGPDQFYQSVILDNDLRNVTDLLITHTHDDHFCYTELGLREMAVKRNEKKLRVYLEKEGYKWFKKMNSGYLGGVNYFDEDLFEIIPIEYYKEYEVGNLKVIPLKGNHKSFGENEYSSNYYITLENNKTLYYAVDSGYFFEETFNFFNGRRIDYLIMECSFGDAFTDEKPDQHMGCNGVMSVLRRLYENGVIDSASKVYITHINHKHTLTYERMVKYFENENFQVPIIVGYDGMSLE